MPNLGKISPTHEGLILPIFILKIGEKMKGTFFNTIILKDESTFFNNFQAKSKHTTGALNISALCSVLIRWNYKRKKSQTKLLLK